MSPLIIETMYSEPYKKIGKKFGNPKLIKYGKEIDVRTWIQENNVDCEVYETLEKYGTIKVQKANLETIKEDMEKLDLRKALDRKIASENLWNSLPLETRKEFNHNADEFMNNGIEWMTKKINDEKKRIADAESFGTKK